MGTLAFSPRAWWKMMVLCHKGDTEVSALGWVNNPQERLLVDDIIVLKQECTGASTDFDMEAYADYVRELCEAGYSMEQGTRVWIHTHPGASASPSSPDEENFKRVYGPASWAVMCILGRGVAGERYARLKVSAGGVLTMQTQLQVVLDESGAPFADKDLKEVEDEYSRLVFRKQHQVSWSDDRSAKWNWNKNYEREDAEYYQRDSVAPGLRIPSDFLSDRGSVMDEYDRLIRAWGDDERMTSALKGGRDVDQREVGLMTNELLLRDLPENIDELDAIIDGFSLGKEHNNGK